MSRHPRTGLITQELLGVALMGLMTAALGCGPDYPKCDHDEDCHKGEFCVNNQCQQCRGNEDCAAGQQCVAGACQAAPQAVSQAPAYTPPDAPTPVAGGCELSSVYFDYDSSTIEGSSRDQLTQDSQCIGTRSIKAVHLTGLTDPRGTEEYNLALGDRRAKAAQQYLKSLGTGVDVSSSSMGEETASGTDESSWARDRRVDVKAK